MMLEFRLIEILKITTYHNTSDLINSLNLIIRNIDSFIEHENHIEWKTIKEKFYENDSMK
ncbi:hypothetical protein BpHYR1_048065 [Brachionus plicatilis]|uniref:Uncharacterized protein n=1 Tax=Brachionus plicatilis TaxID=10195 RepID=A0A3M7S276_BRAPC|nr:hypothetical protein BpHYR1_048065 [Brachionus plicatilis]